MRDTLTRKLHWNDKWNNRRLVKRTAVLAVALLCFGSMRIVTLAEGNSRRNNIKSAGNIDFGDGKAYFASSDLIYLADQVDELEKTYKTTVINALNNIGTYFKSDGSITHDSSQNEMDTEEEKVLISFGQITNGIIESQSVKSIIELQVTDKDGNLLFYIDEEAKNNGNLLRTTTTDTGMPVYYKEASANNLTAGSAAWVNGILIRGNGADNAAHYAQGYIDGQKNVTDNLNITYHYHVHQGDASAIGGCYGNCTGYNPRYCGCPAWAWGDQYGSCATCWHNHAGSVCNYTVGHDPYTYIGQICGKTEDTIESATIVY